MQANKFVVELYRLLKVYEGLQKISKAADVARFEKDCAALFSREIEKDSVTAKGGVV